MRIGRSSGATSAPRWIIDSTLSVHPALSSAWTSIIRRSWQVVQLPLRICSPLSGWLPEAWSLEGRLLAETAAAVAAMAAHSNRVFPDISPCYQNPSTCLLQPLGQLEVLRKRGDQRS